MPVIGFFGLHSFLFYGEYCSFFRTFFYFPRLTSTIFQGKIRHPLVVDVLFRPALHPMLFFRDPIFASVEKIDLIQSLLLAQLHHFAPQVSEKRGRHPMLHSGFGVTRTIHVWHPGYVFDPKTVDDDVGVNVAAMIVTVRVRDHNGLMARKVILAELQTEACA